MKLTDEQNKRLQVLIKEEEQATGKKVSSVRRKHLVREAAKLDTRKPKYTKEQITSLRQLQKLGYWINDEKVTELQKKLADGEKVFLVTKVVTKGGWKTHKQELVTEDKKWQVEVLRLASYYALEMHVWQLKSQVPNRVLVLDDMGLKELFVKGTKGKKYELGTAQLDSLVGEYEVVQGLTGGDKKYAGKNVLIMLANKDRREVKVIEECESNRERIKRSEKTEAVANIVARQFVIDWDYEDGTSFIRVKDRETDDRHIEFNGVWQLETLQTLKKLSKEEMNKRMAKLAVGGKRYNMLVIDAHE